MVQKSKRGLIGLNLFLAVAITACSAIAQAQAVSQWPQRLDSPGGLLTVYQPQPEKFDGDMLTARAAVSLTPPGATDPEFGAMWFHARVSTDRDARLVTIQNIEVKQVKLPNATDDQDKQFGVIIQQQVPSMNLVLSLDQLEATLSVAQKAKEEAQQLQNAPPKIVFTQIPTTLVVLDGPPKLQDSGTPGVMTVVNTPFIMLFDLNSKTYFLKAGTVWMSAPDITASWSAVTNALPAGVAEAGAKLTAQAPPAGAAVQPANTPTQILVAQEPTELITTTGAVTYTPLPGGNLLYMSNTQSDAFLEVASQHYFVLLSGRWFSAASLEGPWTFVASDKLPAAFAQIPADSPKANVLVSVAGTQAAKDARYDAGIPQTTVIQRSSGAALNVTYDGNPQFVPIENTSMTYARNCADPVVDVDNQYYCCTQGVWYQSASPTGPWAVCTVVPPVIYTMPPSCPIYNCRYCYVYDSTPDVVYCGYLPGYTGSYVYGPTVVYGTGYNYPYWYGTQFYACPSTWGFGAQYDYDAGCWGFGASFYYDAGWFANGPDRHRWWGEQGYIGSRDLRAIHDRGGEIRTDERNAVINRVNIYNRPENAHRNAAIRAVNRSEAIDAAHERAPAVHPETAKPAENNVYAGHDGAVYRRTETGWESRDAKGWTPMKTVPEAPVQRPEVQPERQPQERAEPPKENPVRENPVRENPVRENPVREAPVREEPARAEPSPGGLEEEHMARERSAPQQQQPVNSGGGGRVGGAPGRR